MKNIRYLTALLMAAITIFISSYTHSLVAWALMTTLSGYCWGRQFKQWAPIWLLSTLALMLAFFHFTTEESARAPSYYFLFVILTFPALLACSYGAVYKRN